MFEWLDDPFAPPRPIALDDLVVWRPSRAKRGERAGMTLLCIVLVSLVWVAAVHRLAAEPDAIVSSSDAPAPVAPPAKATATSTTTGPDALDPEEPETTPVSGEFDETPPGDKSESTRRVVPPAGAAGPGNDAEAPATDDESPAPPSPTVPPPNEPDAERDQLPTPPAAEETWTATQSIDEIAYGTTPVVDVTFTVRNNTTTARYVGYQDCSPQYNWFNTLPDTPNRLTLDVGPGSGCVLRFAWVQPLAEFTDTVSLTLRMSGGAPIPTGSYELMPGIPAVVLTLQVYPPSHP